MTARSARGQGPASAPLEPAAKPPARRWAPSSVFIALFLLFQLGMPLRYYLAGGGSDERFSWRMFSTVRMQRCTVQVDDMLDQAGNSHEERRVDLRKLVHSAWINLLERGREPVISKLLAQRCAQPGVHSARYTRTCKDTDGTVLPAQKVERRCTTSPQATESARP